jgi:hypothetical protein
MVNPFCLCLLTILKELKTLDSRNTPSTTNLEGEEMVDAPENYGNALMQEQVERPNPWMKLMMIKHVRYNIRCVCQ